MHGSQRSGFLVFRTAAVAGVVLALLASTACSKKAKAERLIASCEKAIVAKDFVTAESLVERTSLKWFRARWGHEGNESLFKEILAHMISGTRQPVRTVTTGDGVVYFGWKDAVGPGTSETRLIIVVVAPAEVAASMWATGYREAYGEVDRKASRIGLGGWEFTFASVEHGRKSYEQRLKAVEEELRLVPDAVIQQALLQGNQSGLEALESRLNRKAWEGFPDHD